jgi:Trypsin-like peptidase domain
VRRLACLLLLLLVAPATCALVIESDAGDVNTRAPAPDPGWANVGLCGGMTAVYLGNGWVITAQHVGASDVVLGGVTHHALPDTAVRLGQEGAPPTADLIVFRIEPLPGLPELPIRPTHPDVGDRVLLIGAGLDRGARTTWKGKPGWSWGEQAKLRWGTNLVAVAGVDTRAGGNVTPGFALRFDPRETRFEAQAATGDSGGAVFMLRKGRFELAGVLLALASFPDQPPHTALYGNLTTAADLSVFRKSIAALVHPH